MKSFNSYGYWGEFALNWLFYLTLILIMLNAINGIIVDTFQQLREESIERESQKNNICFICALKRSYFDFRGESYEFHIKEQHRISNYFYYLIGLKLTNKYDLSSAGTYVLECLDERKTDFFPIKQCLPSKNSES